MTPIHLYTDADNTLWDTDSIFAVAQLQLLNNIENTIGVQAKTTDRLGYVRSHDQAIAEHHPKRLRYPVELLLRAIASNLIGHNSNPLSQSSEKFIIESYFSNLRIVPPLRPGVAESLQQLANMNVPITVLTEGHIKKINSLLVEHRLDKFISESHEVTKDEDLYRRLCVETNPKINLVMVGDQLDRDIIPAQKAGWFTIFYPGGFSPRWISNGTSTGHAKITTYAQVPDILSTLPGKVTIVEEILDPTASLSTNATYVRKVS